MSTKKQPELAKSGTEVSKPEIPEFVAARWQRIVDVMAGIAGVPAGLIMRNDPPQIEVFVSSNSKDNPYEKGERADLETGLYCETVIQQRSSLLVPNALKDRDWAQNPDIELNMIFYLGMPLLWPDGQVFGTICVLDSKERPDITSYRELIAEFGKSVETELALIYESFALKRTQKELLEREARFRTLVESSQTIAFTFDLIAGRYTYMGSRVESWLGYPPESWTDFDSWAERIHPDDREQASEACLSDTKAGRDHVLEFRMITADGRIIWNREVISVISGPDGPEKLYGFMFDITEQKAREAQLEQERRFRTLFDSSSDAIFVVSPGGKFLEVNEVACGRLDYTHEELLGMGPADISHPSCVEQVAARLQLVQSEEEAIFETMHQSRDGRGIPVEISARLIEYDMGDAYLAVARDISERKRIEKELRTTQMHYTDFIEHSTDVVSYWRVPDGFKTDLPVEQQIGMMYQSVCVDANRHAWEGYGLKSKDEMLGKRFADIAVGRTLDDLFAEFIENNYRVIDREARRVLPDGTERWVQGGLWGVVEDATLTHIWSTSNNITERKKAEDELRKLSEVVAQSPMYIVITDTEGIIEYVNPAFEKITGYSQDEILGKNPRVLQSGETPRATFEDLWESLRAGRPWRGELKNKRKDGTPYWEKATISPCLDSQGATTHLVAIKEDITGQIEAEREVEKLLRTKAEVFQTTLDSMSCWLVPDGFSSNATHEEQVRQLMKSVCIDANPPCWKYTENQSPDDVIGKMLQDSADMRAYKSALDLFVSREYKLSNYEVTIATRDGVELHMLESWFGIMENGRLNRIWTITKDISDLRRAQADTRRERALGDRIVNSLPGVFYLFNTEGKMKRWNRNFEVVCGYSGGEISNMQPTDFVAAENVPQVKEAIAEALTKGQATAETTLATKDGTKIPFIITGLRINIDDEPHVIGMGMDISARVKAEKELERHRDDLEELVRERAAELKASEEKFRSLVETTSEWIWEVDSEGRYTYVSPRIKDLLGYEPGEVLGKTPFDLMPPAEAARVAAEFVQLVEARASIKGIENRNLHKDGRLLILETSGLPILGPDGTLLGYRGVDRDITERWETREELRKSEQRFRAIFDDAPVGVVHLDLDGHPLRTNEALQCMLGYSEDEQDEVTFRDVTHPDDMEASAEAMRELVAGNRDSIHLEIRYISKDGRMIWGSTGLSLMRDADGRPHSLIGIIKDISERKRAEEAIVKAKETADAASRAKSEFLASMSHELRTPLNAVIGFSQMLQEKYFGELTEKQEEYVNDIYSSGQHLLSLINDVLDLSKVEAGKMELELSDVDLAQLVEDSLVMIKEKAHKHDTTLEAEIGAELKGLLIPVDERKIKQVMFNLLSNAAKFTPDGGSITVEAGLGPENDILVSVTDTGSGIEPGDQERVFDVFEQAKGGSTDKTPGTGLGLPLSKQFIEMHGGRVWLESEGKDKGSRFSFTLPRERA